MYDDQGYRKKEKRAKALPMIGAAVVIVAVLAWWLQRTPAPPPEEPERPRPIVIVPTTDEATEDPPATAPATAPLATKPAPQRTAVTGTISLSRDGRPREPQPGVPIYVLRASVEAARLADVLAGQIKLIEAGVTESRQAIQELPARIATAKGTEKRDLEQRLAAERAQLAGSESRLTEARAAHASLRPGTIVPTMQAYRTLRKYSRTRPSRFGDLARQTAVSRHESSPDGSFSVSLPPGPHFLFAVRNKPGPATDYVEWLLPLSGDGKPLDLNETTATRQVVTNPNEPGDVGLNDE